MVAYDEKTLYSLKRVRTCALVFATVLLCGFLSAAVVIAFLATKENKTLMSVLSVSLSSLSGWGYLTVLFTVIMPRVKRIKLIGKILSYKKTDITGELVSVGEDVTSPEGVTVSEANIDTSDGVRTVYFEKDFFDCAAFVGKDIIASVAANYICGLKVAEDEKE